MLKVAAFGAITKFIVAGIVMLINGFIEPFTGLHDSFPDLWQIRDLKGSIVFLDQSLEIYIVKTE